MDLNTNAFRIVRTLTDENNREKENSEKARKAGKRGGLARAAALSKERRKEIAVQAVRTRWARNAQ